MEYRKTYSVSFDRPIPDFEGTVSVPLHGGDFSLSKISENRTAAEISVALPVDPLGLSVRTGKRPLDGSPPHSSIHVPEMETVDRIVRSGERVLSFFLGRTMRIGRRIDSGTLVPESDSDSYRLAELGSLPVYLETRVGVSIGEVRLTELDNEVLERILDREVGIALYLDAKAMKAPIGKFREFWRVLESAFGQKGTDLVRSIANYPPAVRMDFDVSELKRLRDLRGRASHAESQRGLSEYNAVSRLVEDALPRLRGLVRAVLLSKRTWGSKSLGVNWLAPLRSWVDRDGTIVLTVDEANAEEGLVNPQ